MDKTHNEPGLKASLLDRLLDDDPGTSEEPLKANSQDVRELKGCVARDLENLLNTRREELSELPPEFAEVNKSLLVYGLPDFSAYNLLSPSDRNHLRRVIEDALTNFEPRLQRVHVTMELPKPNDRNVRFKIEALLRVEPAPEPVVFDTILQLGTQEYLVKRED